MPTLRRRKAKDQDKENTDDAMVDDDDEEEYDDGDHESDADFEGSPAKKKPKTQFGKKFLGEQRVALLEERARYVQSADNLQAEADALLEDRDPGDVQFDDESGEGDTLAVERDLDLALSAQARAAVDEIDAALERIRKGVYGVCVKSGKNIPRERLEVIPWASERVEFKAGGLGRR